MTETPCYAAAYPPFPPPAAETLAFNAALEAALKDMPPPWTVDLNLVRELRARGEGVLPTEGPLERGDWRAVDAAALGVSGAVDGPCRVRVIEPSGGRPSRGVYLHLHGGGWTLGAPDQFDGRCAKIADAAGVTTVSIAYRLGPEHPWPACADDALAGALWGLELARARGGRPVFIGGESAGAHLSAVTLLRLRELGRLSEISAAALTYGCYDLRMTPSMAAWGPRNLILSTPIVDWFIGNLLNAPLGAGAASPLAASPLVSPLLAILDGMPPALFQVGDCDPLLDDSLFMAERWRAAGAAAELRIWPGGIHAFDSFDRPQDALPIAAASQDATARFFSDSLGDVDR